MMVCMAIINGLKRSSKLLVHVCMVHNGSLKSRNLHVALELLDELCHLRIVFVFHEGSGV